MAIAGLLLSMDKKNLASPVICTGSIMVNIPSSAAVLMHLLHRSWVVLSTDPGFMLAARASTCSSVSEHVWSHRAQYQGVRFL